MAGNYQVEQQEIQERIKVMMEEYFNLHDDHAKEERQREYQERIRAVMADYQQHILDNLTEDDINIRALINRYESEHMKPAYRNLCVNCGIDMGYDNPRQYCCKTHCPNDEGEYTHKN
jgi:hypothetical protein